MEDTGGLERGFSGPDVKDEREKTLESSVTNTFEEFADQGWKRNK